MRRRKFSSSRDLLFVFCRDGGVQGSGEGGAAGARRHNDVPPCDDQTQKKQGELCWKAGDCLGAGDDVDDARAAELLAIAVAVAALQQVVNLPPVAAVTLGRACIAARPSARVRAAPATSRGAASAARVLPVCRRR